MVNVYMLLNYCWEIEKKNTKKKVTDAKFYMPYVS